MVTQPQALTLCVPMGGACNVCDSLVLCGHMFAPASLTKYGRKTFPKLRYSHLNRRETGSLPFTRRSAPYGTLQVLSVNVRRPLLMVPAKTVIQLHLPSQLREDCHHYQPQRLSPLLSLLLQIPCPSRMLLLLYLDEARDEQDHLLPHMYLGGPWMRT